MRHGFEVQHATGIAEGRKVAASTPVDVALLDLRLPDGSGLDLLDALVASDPDRPVIMMTAYGSVADAVSAMQRGARDYVQKPLDLERGAAEGRARAAQRAAAARDLVLSRPRDLGRVDPRRIAGDAAPARSWSTRVARMTLGPGAPAPTVLLLGETGSGKGHAARALHAARRPPRRPVHRSELHRAAGNAGRVGALRLREGRLHRRRARRAPALFETAEGGAIFLDEIGHISPALQ